MEAGDGSTVPDPTYAAWKFQTQLLLLRIRLLEAQGEDTPMYRERGLAALRKLIALRPEHGTACGLARASAYPA